MMMNESQRVWLRSYGTLLARIFIGALFLVTGIKMLMSGVSGTADMIEGLGLPLPTLVAWLVILIHIVPGAMVMVGFRTGLGAALLVAFTTLTVLLVHLDLEDPMFLKNLAITGGLLYMMAYGAGEGWSLDKRETSTTTTSMNGIVGGSM